MTRPTHREADEHDAFEASRPRGIQRFRPAAGAFVATLSSATVIGVIVITAQTYGIATSIKEGQEQIERQAESNESSRTDAVSDLTEVAIVAAACADAVEPQTVDQIEKCVLATLRERDNR